MTTPHLHTLLTAPTWNRMILNIYWVMSIIVLGSQFLIYKVVSPLAPFLTLSMYFSEDMFVPDTLFLFIIITLEALNLRKPELTEPAIVAASQLMAIIYLYFVNEHFSVAPLVLLFPMLVSIIYFKIKYLLSSLFLCFLGLFCVSQYAGHREPSEIIDLIIMASVMLAAAFTGLGVIRRGGELIDTLDKVQQSEQELRIQTIVMERMSGIDPLTGLHNHKAFHEYMQQLLDQQNRNPFTVQLAILDIDNFKQVNDTFGHWVGDIALKQVGTCISKHIGSNDFAARYGGEEFVIIICESEIDKTLQTIERLRKAIALSPIAEMNHRQVTVSIGLHDIVGGESKEHCFQQADQALYTSKKLGKNQTTVQ